MSRMIYRLFVAGAFSAFFFTFLSAPYAAGATALVLIRLYLGDLMVLAERIEREL